MKKSGQPGEVKLLPRLVSNGLGSGVFWPELGTGEAADVDVGEANAALLGLLEAGVETGADDAVDWLTSCRRSTTWPASGDAGVGGGRVSTRISPLRASRSRVDRKSVSVSLLSIPCAIAAEPSIHIIDRMNKQRRGVHGAQFERAHPWRRWY